VRVIERQRVSRRCAARNDAAPANDPNPFLPKRVDYPRACARAGKINRSVHSALRSSPRRRLYAGAGAFERGSLLRPSTDANEMELSLSSRSRADDDKYGSLNCPLDFLAAIARTMTLVPFDDALSAETVDGAR